MPAIRNIIFDLGGVFMNIDFRLTEKAFADLGVAHFHTMFTQHHANDLFVQLEIGAITPETFYEQFRQATGTALGDHQIRDAWNALLLHFPQERLDWLKEIRNRYRVFLFSNTNQIHYDSFIASAAKENNCPDFNGLFEKAYYSHEFGRRKPVVSAFTDLLALEALDAADTLFIDDTIANIEGAKQAGLQTIHLVAPQTVLDLGL
jgi:putative hydrolase of the HAD superfamily